MVLTVLPILGSILLLAGVSLVIVSGNALAILGGSEVAVLGLVDAVGVSMALVGMALSTLALARRERAVHARFYAAQGLYAALFAGCLVLIGLIALNHNTPWDATEARIHSLTPQTRRYLQGLRIPIEIVAFHAPGENVMDRARLWAFLRRYSEVSPSITVHIFNPVSQPFKAARFAPDVRPGDLFVRRLDADTTASARVRRFRSVDEETVTNAIVQTVMDRRVTIHFLQGHHEKALGPSDAEPSERVANMAAYLRERGFSIAPLDLVKSGGEGLDPRGSILICAGPRVDLRQAERERIETFLDNGGKALFLLDPVFNLSVELIEFRRLLDRYGVAIQRDIVFDFTSRRIANQMRFPVVMARFGSHAIAENMPPITTVMDAARTVRRREIARPDLSAVEFLFSPPQSSFSVDLRQALLTGKINRASIEGREPAELPLAVAVEKRLPGQTEEQATKLVVFGDCDLFTDRLWDQTPATLLTNAVNWLGASEAQIAVPSRRVEMPPLIISPVRRRALQVSLVLFLPFAVFFGGVGYTLARRRLG